MLEGLVAPLRAEFARLQQEFTPDVLMKAGFSAMAEFVLYACAKAGPPDWFATQYNLSPEQAQKLYESVLYGAITRNVGALNQERLEKVKVA